ncbi:hypothetical protein ACS0TY_012418 [Phlomoides rotata]
MSTSTGGSDSGDTPAAILSNEIPPGLAREQPKPRWLTAVLSKNFVLVVVLSVFVRMMNSGRRDVGDFERKLSGVEKLVKTTVDAIDRKFEDRIRSVRKEFDENARSGAAFENFTGSKGLLTKEEFSEMVRDYAKAIVLKEIEKHAADGLGMADYALESGGARVLRHSDPLGGFCCGNKVCAEAERMISPSFGQPGHCFPLKGGSGFVEIGLRTAILPEAVTLEHVAKSVAYDRSSAPKHCRVSGWLRGRDATDRETPEKMFLLTEFTYDLDKSNAQTFKVDSSASNLVDTVRLDFMSNHGSATHTCIYRLRVHGY